jgi:putative hydrolase of the HAD superfamily
LLASAGEIGREVCAPAFAAIRNANRGTLSDERLNAAFADCFWHSLDSVAAQYGFSDEMRAVGWKYFSQMEVQGALRGYADLAALAELPILRDGVQRTDHAIHHITSLAELKHFFATPAY